jgi:hypothetical protein
MKLVNSGSLPLMDKKRIWSNVDFSYAPVWTILLPLSNGSVFSSDQAHANIIMETSSSFEEQWNDVIGELHEKRFIGKLLMKNWLFWLFKILARIELKKYFNSCIKKDAIIILNATLSPRIMKTITYNLPIYTTYGMQECNHILAINDYSTMEHGTENCVGTFVEGVSGDIRKEVVYNDEGSLLIVSTALSKDLTLEKDVWYDTRDHASVKNGLLFIYGKIRYLIKNSNYVGSNLENIERIMKNIPYFKEVFIFEDGNNLYHLMVYPNNKVVEAMKYGLLDFNNLIKPYTDLINERFGIDFLVDIKIVFHSFLKSHTGKIQKGLYFLASRRDAEEYGF